jgi:hypothetical protein
MVLALAICASCNASVGGGTNTADGPDPTPIDAAIPVDAAPDARPCTGGDQSMMAPDGSCFLLFTTPKTFADATLACEASGAHLALLKTAELDSVAEQFVGTLDTYIGLSDEQVEGAFVWGDGTPLAFANWHTATNEPNNSGGGGYEEDCAIIAGARVGKQWDDRPCVPVPDVGGGLYAYLCQF